MFLVFIVSFSAFAACKNGRDGNNSEKPPIGVTETEIYNIKAIMFGEPTKTEEKPEKTDSLPFNGEKITLNAERTSVKGEEIFGYDGNRRNNRRRGGRQLLFYRRSDVCGINI